MIQIKTESKSMKVSLLMFDRLLHKNKIEFNNMLNCWVFTSLQLGGKNK